MAERPLILDTCALLWLAEGAGRLTEDARSQIDSAPIVYVSAISGFEIGIKHSVGKLTLPVEPGQWFAEILAHHGLEVLDLDLSICLRSTQLPEIHRDPCDRLIIAAAQLHRLPIVSGDRIFEEYDVELIR